jgi:hypothetical protein
MKAMETTAIDKPENLTRTLHNSPGGTRVLHSWFWE